MASLSTAVLAAAVISTGMVSTAGVALAADGPTYQEGLVNSSHFAPNTTGALCNNDVPVNAAGVQVPVQDLGLGIPLLSSASDHGNGAAVAKSCVDPIAARN